MNFNFIHIVLSIRDLLREKHGTPGANLLTNILCAYTVHIYVVRVYICNTVLNV